jgi:hypothetical protein
MLTTSQIYDHGSGSAADPAPVSKAYKAAMRNYIMN